MILDAHVHCGLTLPREEVFSRWKEAGIDGGVLFSPVEEIYDRYNPGFTDSEYYRESRRKVHKYLESLAGERIFLYWFVWNDFALPGDRFCGVKWHRHSGEPHYNYDSQECHRFLEHICGRRLPVIIEEEFHNTMELVRLINGRTVIIIPHLGMLNGGYQRLKQAGLFEEKTVFVDTALASKQEITDFADSYGVERILFGSDYPFGIPARELSKVEEIFSGADLKKVLAGNLLSVLGEA